MDSFGAENCSVCFLCYDEDEHRPRFLNCGHTFCTACLEELIRTGDNLCPRCRVRHQAKTVTDIPVSYEVESLVQQVKSLQVSKPSLDPSTTVAVRLGDLVIAEHCNIESLCQDAQDTQEQLSLYEQQLQHFYEDHLRQEVVLHDLSSKNRVAMQQLMAQKSLVADLKKEGHKVEQQKGNVLQQLESALNVQEEAAAVDRSANVRKILTNWNQRCLAQFPDPQVILDSIKVRQAIRTGVELACAEDLDQVTAGVAGSITVKMDQLTHAAGRKPSITREKLKKMVQLVSRGFVKVAVEDDRLGLWSHLTVEEDRVHLYSLKDQRPPPHHYTIKASSLLSVREMSARLVFLDVAWGGMTRGRIYIRLLPDNNLAQQFLLFCSGERGCSYASTKLLWVDWKGKAGENVMGGDYLNNNGTTAPPLLPDLDSFANKVKPAMAGLVGSRHNKRKDWSGLFYIVTRDKPSASYPGSLGTVVSGLQVVQEALRLTNLKEATIYDCGVVVPV